MLTACQRYCPAVLAAVAMAWAVYSTRVSDTEYHDNIVSAMGRGEVSRATQNYSSQTGQADSRGEDRTREPVYQGERATAPIKSEKHVKNEGGSDGAGLCVIASITANGIYQGVPGLDVPDSKGETGHGSALWEAAKKKPGGYYPGKLQALVDSVMPGEKWASVVDTNPAILDTLSRKGLAIGATMNTGANYNYKRIHHMVSLIHYRTNGWACVVDNNFPGVFSWMPATEFDRRWIDGGTGWAWVWTRQPSLNPQSIDIGFFVFVLAAIVLVATIVRRRTGMETQQ